MQCSICNYNSPEGAKFCRQCGAPLFSESELSGAGTRNYGRQDNGPALSAPLPNPAPSVVDAFGPETARYAKPQAAASVGTSNLPPIAPMYAQHAPVYMPPIQNTAPIKSQKRRFLKFAGGLFLLLLAGGIGAGINEEANSGRVRLSRDDQVRLERMRNEDRLKGSFISATNEQSDRLQNELRQQLEDVERAKEDARRAAERGGSESDVTLLDLKEFEYPEATSAQSSRIPGKELTTLRTRDDFETIVRYYQSKLGEPYVVINDRNNKRALFQSNGSPSVTVFVQDTNDRNRDKISIMRSPFRFRKLQGVLAGQPEAANGKPFIKVETNPAKPAAPPAPAAPAKSAQAPEVR